MIRSISLIIALVFIIGTGAATPPHGVKLSPEQKKVVEAVMGRKQSSNSNSPTTSRLVKLRDENMDPSRLSSSGSMIQGYATKRNGTSGVSGWYEFYTDGWSKLLWEYPLNYTGDPDERPDFPLNVGFLRNGKIYGFSSEVLLYWLIGGYGVFTLDGRMIDYHYYDDLETDMSRFVISCAYDPSEDMVYAYTLNSDATGYAFQKINPETWDFSEVNSNVKLEDVAIGFTYNNADHKFYSATTDGRFCNVNVTDGSVNQLSRLSMPVSLMCQGLVYSPIDKCFYYIFGSSSNDAALYKIDRTTYKDEYVSDLYDIGVVSILVTEDVEPEGDVPSHAEVIWVTMEEATGNGTADLVLPEKDFSGNELSGEVTVKAAVGEKIVGSSTGQPGETVSVILSGLPDGQQTVTFTPSCNGLEGIRTESEIWVGYDFPGTPYNINLEAGSVTWSMPWGGIHGGYVNDEELTYNVYINGVKSNTEPIKGMEYSFTMPDEQYTIYGAEVEADNHGKLSDRGYSNNLLHGSPLPMPVEITPTLEQNKLCTVVANGGITRFSWLFNPNGYFVCYSSGMGEEEWLFLPPVVNVTDSENLIEVSLETCGESYFDPTVENIEVYISPDTDPENAVKVGDISNIPADDIFMPRSVYFAKQSGEEFRVALKVTKHSDGNRVLVKDIKIALSDLPGTLPAAVEDFKLVAHPEGALGVDVSFTLPVKDAAGNDLNKDEKVKYTAISRAETKEESGFPGESVTVTLMTKQGLNEISVRTSDNEKGYTVSGEIFTGLDKPAPLEAVTVIPSEDLKSMTVRWEPNSVGADGGYVNPEEVTYTICTPDEEGNWVKSYDIGTATEYVYTPVLPASPQLNVVEIGILSENDRGNCGVIRTAFAVLGKPYSLPVIENLEDGGLYHPLVYAGIDSGHEADFALYRSAYPNFIGDPTPNGGSAAFIAEYYDFYGESAKASITLPPVDTHKDGNIGVELPIYCSYFTAPVTVYGEAYGTGKIALGTFVDNESMGWVKKRFLLPDNLKNREWVTISIETEVTEEHYRAAVADYRIMDFLDNDVSLFEASAPLYPIVGNTYQLTAVAENEGQKDTATPSLTCIITRGDEVLASVEMLPDKEALPSLENVSYTAEWTPTANHIGELKCSFTLNVNDQKPDNDIIVTECVVGAGNQYVVKDLKATNNDNGEVELSWTQPDIKYGFEGFENFVPFTFGDALGEFETIDDDGEETMNFIDITYPNELVPRAWQVWSESTMTEILKEADSQLDPDFVSAATGDKYAIAIRPYSIVMFEGKYADDWMISPEVVGGTALKFMMYACSSADVVEIYTSSWSNGIWDMELLDKAIALDMEWKKFEFTLPEDAKYFALRYVGDSDYGYFVKIDDIEYVPAAAPTEITGYDIYRDGEFIAENAQAFGSFTDAYAGNSNTFYNVVPVLSQDSDYSRGLMSNSAYVGVSGVMEIKDKSNVTIFGGDGMIEINGLSNQSVDIYTPDGKMIASDDNLSGATNYAVAPGVYIVNTGTTIVKVIVR